MSAEASHNGRMFEVVVEGNTYSMPDVAREGFPYGHNVVTAKIEKALQGKSRAGESSVQFPYTPSTMATLVFVRRHGDKTPIHIARCTQMEIRALLLDMDVTELELVSAQNGKGPLVFPKVIKESLTPDELEGTSMVMDMTKPPEIKKTAAEAAAAAGASSLKPKQSLKKEDTNLSIPPIDANAEDALMFIIKFKALMEKHHLEPGKAGLFMVLWKSIQEGEPLHGVLEQAYRSMAHTMRMTDFFKTLREGKVEGPPEKIKAAQVWAKSIEMPEEAEEGVDMGAGATIDLEKILRNLDSKTPAVQRAALQTITQLGTSPGFLRSLMTPNGLDSKRAGLVQDGLAKAEQLVSGDALRHRKGAVDLPKSGRDALLNAKQAVDRFVTRRSGKDIQ